MRHGIRRGDSIPPPNFLPAGNAETITFADGNNSKSVTFPLNNLNCTWFRCIFLSRNYRVIHIAGKCHGQCNEIQSQRCWEKKKVMHDSYDIADLCRELEAKRKAVAVRTGVFTLFLGGAYILIHNSINRCKITAFLYVGCGLLFVFSVPVFFL